MELNHDVKSFGAMETIRAAYWINLGRTAIVGAMSDLPTASTLLGGAVIAAATLWVARREAQRRGTDS